jgi:hypothetical protein
MKWNIDLLVFVCLYVIYHTARRDTLHTLPLDKVTSDHKDRNMFAYILRTQHTERLSPVIISQH